MLYVDGFTTSGGSRVGLIIVSLEGHSREMVFDNGCQFDTDLLQNYCDEYGIQKRLVAVAKPQMNGNLSPPTSRP